MITDQRPATSLPLRFHLDQFGYRSWVQAGDHLVRNLRSFQLRCTYDGATEVAVAGITDRDESIDFTGVIQLDSGVQLGPPPAPSEYEPDHTGPRMFTLVRDSDISGISGTGTVAEGVQYSDGRVSLRWVTPRARSTVAYDSILDVVEIHGHAGSTRVVWL